jgi:hypothetical protein
MIVPIGDHMDDLLTETEAARYCHLGIEYFKNLRKRGTGPTYLKVTGKTIRYRTADIEAWIAAWPEKPAKTDNNI